VRSPPLKPSAPAPPRLPLVQSPADPLAREVFAQLQSGRGILNLHRMMAHAPPLMKASGDMAMAFRTGAMLPRSLAEIVVLRTAQLVDCDYVWGRHLPLARAAGVTEQQIAEIAHWPDSAAFAPPQKAALGFAEKAARGATIEDATFSGLRQSFSDREIVELTMLVAFYVSTAIFIKTLAVPDE
jgi:4-carboxymuconolactone decarboxylase